VNLSADSLQVLVAFGVYLAGVAALGVFSHRYLGRGSFVKEYFLGNRGLGPWVLALTVAATAVSGGTFMGFPSLIYTNGWVMALWICSYMVVPLTTMALMGKRLNQVARVSGAVTVPDVFRDRFGSPTLGIVATLLILLFLTFNLVAQFKGGGLVMKEALRLPPAAVALPGGTQVDLGYLLGLLIFAGTVIAYTTYGGFWAVTWTDVLEGLVMLVGVVVLAVLAVQAVPPLDGRTGLAAATEHLRRQDPALVYGPGPNAYLPLGLGFSFFVMWSLMSPGQPSGMVRLMSFRDSASLRRALVLVCGYYFLTYVSLLVIFVCARAIFPTQYLLDGGSEGVPDQIMPAMVRHLAHPLVAGLLLAAPYAAIMSTVAAFLLLISSSLVRDIYQRTINPNVSPRTIKFLSYLVTGTVGVVVMLGALHPPDYLQYIIVFSGTGQGCAFLVPMLLTLYWRRATRAGVLASMLAGFAAMFALYVLGWLDSAGLFGDALRGLPGAGQVRPTRFAPLYLGGVDTLIWGLLASLALGVGVSLCTQPEAERLKKYFP
jgi:SSS family transporter